MICAPATGCVLSSFISRASAGGQLEHPSEVNNSANTGTRGLGSAAWRAAARTVIRKRLLIRPLESTSPPESQKLRSGVRLVTMRTLLLYSILSATWASAAAPEILWDKY